MSISQGAVDKSKKVMNVMISVATTLSVLGGAFFLVYNNLWKPYVTVIDVDWQKGFADIHVNGKAVQLVKNAKVTAGGDWAVRFNASSGDMEKLDRIELVKGDVVYITVLRKEDDPNAGHPTVVQTPAA